MRKGVLWSPIVWSIVLTILSVALLPGPLLAHSDPNAAIPSLAALKVEDELELDGLLNEPFWQEAQASSSFTDIRTGQPAEQPTVVRIAYTSRDLYVAVECFDDDIDQIHASELREDRYFNGDDWVEVHFDPTHSHRAKYAFYTNPLGTRMDGSEGPSGVFNRGWSAEWEVATHVGEDRWTLEMRIPFGIMNYVKADGQTWGLNVTRKLVRTDVTSFWSFSKTDYFKPRHFGHLTGLDLADTRFDRNFEVTPYVSTRTDFNGRTETEVQGGADLSFRLTPSVITSWTVNPDFGQVEADADTIELRDTERFLPEKRLFFREGDELVQMPHRLYYSRRFTDIDAGAKVSGDWRNYKFSFLNVHGHTVNDETRYGNSSVFRLLQPVGERSTLGHYLNASELTTGHSRVAGTDGDIFLTDAYRVKYQMSVADDDLEAGSETSAKNRTDYLGYTSFGYDKYPWDIWISYVGITEDFDPFLGYVPRRDIFGPSLFSRYYLRSGENWYKTLAFSYRGRYYENEADQVVLRDHEFDADVVFQNDIGLSMDYDHDYHAPYRNRRTRASLSFDDSDYWRSTEVGWAFGTFEEIDYDELVFGKRLKPLEAWPIRYEFTIRFEEKPDGDEETLWLNRVVFDYFFTDDMWLKTSIQNRSKDIRNISLIYGWEFVQDAHWYMAFNSVQTEDDEDPIHSLFVKLAYTFR